MPATNGLTPKQERFCLEYLVDLNATQAAIRAGYSQESAGTISNENMQKPEIQEYIQALRVARSAETKIDAAWLLTRLADEANADVNDLYAENGALKPVAEWPEIWRKGLIQGLETEENLTDEGIVTRIRKIKLSDRVKRLELIGKHIGVQAFKDQIGLTGTIGITITEDDAKL